MKKTLSILLLSMSTLPALALAAGSHDGGHEMAGETMQGHDMTSMTHGGTATGHAGDPGLATRTVEIVMQDTMRFTPDTINVKAGDTIRFLVQNAGRIPHEMVIGSIAELRAHAATMQKSPGMAHTERNMIALEPGQHGELVWQFTQAGTVDFACLIAGHMEAGMVGKVRVG